MNLYRSPGYTLSIYHKRSFIVILGSISSLDMLILQFFLIRMRVKLSLATKNAVLQEIAKRTHQLSFP